MRCSGTDTILRRREAMNSSSHSPVSHQFKNPALLELALTHASTSEPEDNERLEFLGDAVLDLIVAEELYAQSPSLSEGQMTEYKSSVVARGPLATAAIDIGLDQIARLGAGLARRILPKSVMANLYEAVLGAIFLDAGLDASRAFVKSSLRLPLRRAKAHEARANPKQVLQHVSQRLWGSPPVYVELDSRGSAHARAFLVAAEAGGEQFPGAWGRTRKEAERWAAHEAVLVLEDRGDA